MAMDQSKFLEDAKQIAMFPENKWVLDLFNIAIKMGLYPAPVNDTPPELLLLDLPEKCEKPLLEHTQNNGLLIHAIPLTIFLSQFAYQFAKDIRPLQQNKYFSNLIKENNEVWRGYLDLQREFMELKDGDVE